VIASWRVIDVPFGPEEGYRWVEVAPADAVTTIAVVPPPPGGSTGNRETGIGLHESPRSGLGSRYAPEPGRYFATVTVDTPMLVSRAAAYPRRVIPVTSHTRLRALP
jgi:hypothetical protein